MPSDPLPQPAEAPEPGPGPFVGSASPYTRQQLRTQRFTRVTRDVYVRVPALLDLRARVAAARLVLPGSVACLQTAALLTKLPVDDDGLVHLARGRGAARSERDGVEVHRLVVRDDEVLEVRGLRLTDGPRTLADLAAALSEEQLVAVGDVVLRRYNAAALAEAVARARRRPGVELLRRVAPLLDAGSDSPAESRARLRLHRAGFTALVHGISITDGYGGWLADPDLADPVARVAVQHEGATHFAKGEAQRIHDVDRDELSREAGWIIVISTKKDDADPDQLIRKVTNAYLQAARLYGRQVLPPHLR